MAGGARRTIAPSAKDRARLAGATDEDFHEPADPDEDDLRAMSNIGLDEDAQRHNRRLEQRREELDRGDKPKKALSGFEEETRYDEGIRFHRTSGSLVVYVKQVLPKDNVGSIPVEFIQNHGALCEYLRTWHWDGREAIYRWTMKEDGKYVTSGEINFKENVQKITEYRDMLRKTNGVVPLSPARRAMQDPRTFDAYAQAAGVPDYHQHPQPFGGWSPQSQQQPPPGWQQAPPPPAPAPPAPPPPLPPAAPAPESRFEHMFERMMERMSNRLDALEEAIVRPPQYQEPAPVQPPPQAAMTMFDGYEQLARAAAAAKSTATSVFGMVDASELSTLERKHEMELINLRIAELQRAAQAAQAPQTHAAPQGIPHVSPAPAVAAAEEVEDTPEQAMMKRTIDLGIVKAVQNEAGQTDLIMSALMSLPQIIEMAKGALDSRAKTMQAQVSAIEAANKAEEVRIAQAEKMLRIEQLKAEASERNARALHMLAKARTEAEETGAVQTYDDRDPGPPDDAPEVEEAPAQDVPLQEQSNDVASESSTLFSSP